jgi:hypothetical protein
MVDERGRDEKSNMQMVEEGRKMKCEITTGLFSALSKTVSIPEDLGHWLD